MGFLEADENCRLDAAKRTLWLTKILSWYSSDFGKNRVEVARTVATFLRGDRRATLEAWTNDGSKFSVRHLAYDWTPDSANSLVYSSGATKTESVCVLS